MPYTYGNNTNKFVPLSPTMRTHAEEVAAASGWRIEYVDSQSVVLFRSRTDDETEEIIDRKLIIPLPSFTDTWKYWIERFENACLQHAMDMDGVSPPIDYEVEDQRIKVDMKAKLEAERQRIMNLPKYWQYDPSPPPLDHDKINEMMRKLLKGS